MTASLEQFRQATCAALIGAGVTQSVQIISTVAALEKFVFSKDEYKQETTAKTEKTTKESKVVEKTEEQKAEITTKEEVQAKVTANEETVAEEIQTNIPNFTKDEVHKALVGVAQKHGRAALVKLLGEVNAEKLTDVAESDYPKLMKLVEDYPA